MDNSSVKEKGYSVFAVLVVLCAVILSAYSVRVSPAKISRLKRKLNDLRVVQAMYQQMKTDQAAVTIFQADCPTPPDALRDILKQSLPDITADVRQRQSKPTASGWTALRAEVVFNDVLLEKVGLFIQTAENKRPPWMLQECNIVASEGEGGFGRATLVMEALERGKDSGS